MSAVFGSWTVVAGQTESSMFILAGQSRRVSSENRFDTYAAEFGQASGGRTSHLFTAAFGFWAGLRPSASQPITKP